MSPGLAELSGRRPDEIAVECGTTSLTWGELEDRSLRVANALQVLGFRPGAHVAICVSNRIEFVESLIGTWRAGAAYTPVKTGWTAAEVGHLLDDAATSVVITDRGGARTAARDRGIAVLDLDDGYADLLDTADHEPIPDDRCGYKLPYTSGTTGRPKGVVMSGSGTTPFAAGWSGIARYAEQLGLPGDGVHLFCTRLFNGAPQTFGFGALARGATLRILPRWDAWTGVKELCRADVTSTIMVPTMFRQLLALDDIASASAPSLRTILHGGEPCPVPVKQGIADVFGDVLVEYYGFTEGGMAVVGPGEWQSRPGTVGKPLPGLSVRILDDGGNNLPAGVDGTVYFEPSAGRRFHYRADESKTEAAHHGDAFTVGDIGHLDEDGYLYLSGRAADVVIIAGVNVYPAEIEHALADVPGVADLCAVGAPDPDRGEAVVLFVTLGEGADEQQVRADLAARSTERIAPYKQARDVRVIDEIPRDETGKLLRRLLRDQAASPASEPRLTPEQ